MPDEPLPSDTEHTQRLARIAADPRYQDLLKRRSRFTWLLSSIMLIAFFSYILLIAFDKPFLAQPIGNGTTSLGIPIGLGLILLGILLTGIYVRRANKDFDPMVASIREELDQ